MRWTAKEDGYLVRAEHAVLYKAERRISPPQIDSLHHNMKITRHRLSYHVYTVHAIYGSARAHRPLDQSSTRTEKLQMALKRRPGGYCSHSADGAGIITPLVFDSF